MVHEVQFARGTFYKAGGGKTHLKHALRDRYNESRIPEPNILFYKYDGSVKETTKDEIYELYDYNLNHRLRKNANVYFEYMVSGYDPNKTVDIAEYLHKMFEGRPIFIAEHFDESHYHTHFIIFSKDAEHSKSPNLKKNDLHMLRINVGKITEQKVKERGTGLKKHINTSSDPERVKALVEDQEREAEQMKQIQKQIKPLLDLYGAIEIHSLNREKGMVFKVYNYAGRTVFTDVDQLPMRKLMQIDSKPGEHIVFRPVPDEQNRVKAVFLDDVPEDRFDELPNGTIVVETSPGKYQAHIPLPKPFSQEDATTCQSKLVGYFESDIGGKALLHFRRLPGFTNKKYKEQPVAKIVKAVQNNVDLMRLLGDIEDNRLVNDLLQEERWRMLEQKTPAIAKQVEQILDTEGETTWQRFYNESDGDRSAADLKYCMRLYRKGFDPQAIAYALIEVSPDLELRKPKHVEDYVNRTVGKAIRYVDNPISMKQKDSPEKGL